MSVSINNIITAALITQLKKKSVLYLPNRPGEKNVTAAEVKEALIGLITDSDTSIVKILDTLITNINTAITSLESDRSSAITTAINDLRTELLGGDLESSLNSIKELVDMLGSDTPYQEDGQAVSYLTLITRLQNRREFTTTDYERLYDLNTDEELQIRANHLDKLYAKLERRVRSISNIKASITYVDSKIATAISELKNGASSTWDTLNEIEEILNNSSTGLIPQLQVSIATLQGADTALESRISALESASEKVTVVVFNLYKETTDKEISSLKENVKNDREDIDALINEVKKQSILIKKLEKIVNNHLTEG